MKVNPKKIQSGLSRVKATLAKVRDVSAALESQVQALEALLAEQGVTTETGASAAANGKTARAEPATV